MSDKQQVTNLLIAWQDGDEGALEQLSPYIYKELRRLAARAMHGEGAGHTLQTTALVHEAFMRLVDADIEVRGRHEFFALAARMMRGILVDHARAKRRVKRGGGEPALSLEAAGAGAVADTAAVLELDDALTRLAELEPRAAETVELVYFGGLSYEEAATARGVSRTTVFEDLRFAKAWLRNALS